MLPILTIFTSSTMLLCDITMRVASCIYQPFLYILYSKTISSPSHTFTPWKLCTNGLTKKTLCSWSMKRIDHLNMSVWKYLQVHAYRMQTHPVVVEELFKLETSNTGSDVCLLHENFEKFPGDHGVDLFGYDTMRFRSWPNRCRHGEGRCLNVNMHLLWCLQDWTMLINTLGEMLPSTLCAWFALLDITLSQGYWFYCSSREVLSRRATEVNALAQPSLKERKKILWVIHVHFFYYHHTIFSSTGPIQVLPPYLNSLF